MAHKKKHGPPPIPPANRPSVGPAVQTNPGQGSAAEGGGAPFKEQDAKRRLGDFKGMGEHPLQQPSARNDGQQHSR